MKRLKNISRGAEAHFYLGGKKLEGVTSIDVDTGVVEIEEIIQKPGYQPTKRKRTLTEGTLIIYLNGQ